MPHSQTQTICNILTSNCKLQMLLTRVNARFLFLFVLMSEMIIVKLPLICVIYIDISYITPYFWALYNTCMTMGIQFALLINVL